MYKGLYNDDQRVRQQQIIDEWNKKAEQVTTKNDGDEKSENRHRRHLSTSSDGTSEFLPKEVEQGCDSGRRIDQFSGSDLADNAESISSYESILNIIRNVSAGGDRDSVESEEDERVNSDDGYMESGNINYLYI